MAYANGYLPASALAHAANGTSAQVLETQTARQWSAMVAAAAADGITLRPQADGDVPSCYRDFAGQQRAAVIEAHGGPEAATPGYSNHGTGIAIDIYMGAGVFAWLSNNAARFGFDNVQGKASGENWHWVRTRVVDVTGLASSNSTPVEEDDMQADERQALFAVRDALMIGGDSMPDNKFPIGKTVADLRLMLAVVQAKVTQPVIRDGKQVAQIQDNADTNTMVRSLTAAVGALQNAVTAIATSQGVNPQAIQDAAQRGATAALNNLTLKAVTK